MKNKLPTDALYYFSRVFSSKGKQQKASELRTAVAECVEVCEKFKFFSMNEWCFDSGSVAKLNAFLTSSQNANAVFDFEIDI